MKALNAVSSTVPLFHISNESVQLPGTPPSAQSKPSVSPTSSSQTHSRRTPKRPSTAPQAEPENLLDSQTQAPGQVASPSFVPDYGYIPSSAKGKRRATMTYMQTVDEDEPDQKYANSEFNLGEFPRLISQATSSTCTCRFQSVASIGSPIQRRLS